MTLRPSCTLLAATELASRKAEGGELGGPTGGHAGIFVTIFAAGIANAADINFVSAMAEQYGRHGVRINTVNPGPVNMQVFFISGADAGSVVMGMLSSKGNLHPRSWNIIVWGVFTGAAAAICLLAGAIQGSVDVALSALQAVAIASAAATTRSVCA